MRVCWQLKLEGVERQLLLNKNHLQFAEKKRIKIKKVRLYIK
ncbi:hypothetical protein SD77_2870 [Bacillus badius]|uniref:Mobile element protein n=1 Tax=Bacillus badius TaxID=1455 RepID=A0ABR5APW7_BACBA|nr:hypothetical protein SD77_2870 [Bacillus badius]